MPQAIPQVGQLVLEFLLDVVRFPWWWYSGGLRRVAAWCWRGFEATRLRLSLGLFLKYFFTPMYQDYSFSGRAISLVMRFVLLLAKVGRLVVAALWYLALVVAWVVLLPLTLLLLFS